MAIEIVTGEKYDPRPGHSKYPFADMEVNDFFEVPEWSTPDNAANAAHAWGVRHGCKFSLQRIADAPARIWRVK